VTYDRDKRNGILSCCAHQIFFATNDLATAQYVSESCGNQTIETISTSKRKSMKYEAPTHNTSQRGTPLIAKHEMRDFNTGEQIILVEGSQPIKCKKIEYYKDKNFKDREVPPPAVPELIISDNAIPYFDIQSDQSSKAQEKDPNQTEIDYSPPEDLTDGMPELEQEGELEVMRRLSGSLK